MRKFTKLFCTAFLLLGGFVSASAQDETQDETFDLTADMFYTWDGYGADASSTGTVQVDFNLNKDLEGGNVVCGTGGVDYLIYADLTGSTKLLFQGTPGLELRVLMNRQESNSGPLTEMNPKLGDDGKAELDVTKLNYVHINAIKVNWGGKGQVNSIQFVKPADPLAINKEQLKSALSHAKLQSPFAKTEASWNALQQAIADGEAALAAATDATSLNNAKDAIVNAEAALTLIEGYSDLTADMLFSWTGWDATAVKGNQVNGSYVLFTSTSQPYGDGNVIAFADLSKYEKLQIVSTGGTPRFLLNRDVNEGQWNENEAESHLIDNTKGDANSWHAKYFSQEGDVYTVDLAQLVADKGYAHLHAIKTVGGNVVVKGMYLYHEPVVTPIELTLAEGDIAAALAAEKAKIEPLDIVGDITINLTKGAYYTISAPIVAAGNVTIATEAANAARGAKAAELAIIDASTLTGPMFTTPSEEGTWTANTFSLSNVSIKGLAQPLFASAAKNYLFTDFTVDNSIVEVVGDVTVFDFTKGSVAVNFNVTNSTFYAPTATTKAMYSSQSGQKATEAGEYIQTFKFANNTIYNFAPAKNFFSHRQNNQKWQAYDVQNNIFVNCGKSGQTIKGMNGGTPGPNPIWTIIGNAFNFDGADTSAAEATGDDEEPVQNSVAGVVTFTDAANGDFNGTFELAEGAQAPEALGDGRWTINFGGEVAQGIIYVWDAGTETGGEAVASDGESVGLANAGFTTIRLNGAKDYSTNVVTITLAQELKTGDKINFTAYRNKNAANKQSGVKAKFDKGGEISTTTGLEFVNIDQSDDSAEDSNRGTEPNTISFDIPAEAAGSTVITMTRAATQTNLFITKIEIGDGTTVGINTIQQATVNSNAIYNMNGQRVMNAQKGLYIVNGKKVIVK